MHNITATLHQTKKKKRAHDARERNRPVWCVVKEFLSKDPSLRAGFAIPKAGFSRDFYAEVPRNPICSILITQPSFPSSSDGGVCRMKI